MRPAILVISLLSLALLAACTAPHDGAHGADGDGSPQGHEGMHHPAVASEEAFIAEMIPHHQEAVDTSRLVLESSQDPQVRALAQDIIQAQEREIAMMRGWLDAWYAGSHYHPTYAPMMPDLAALDGEARDKAYLEGMVLHHEGAIMMARQAQELELREEVRALTDDIIRTQQAEIAQMEGMLRE